MGANPSLYDEAVKNRTIKVHVPTYNECAKILEAEGSNMSEFLRECQAKKVKKGKKHG